MQSFPSYAKIHLAGFGEERESAVQRTAMESGPPKQLKTKSRVLVTRGAQIRLSSQADYLLFKTWFSTSLNEGADWFTWTDPVAGASATVRFVGGIGRAVPLAALSGAWVIDAQIESWSA